MSEFSPRTFEIAVARFFQPIAAEYGWQMIRCGSDAYEIVSPHAVMRVDYFQGQHTRSMNLRLRPQGQLHGSTEETGVWPIAGYNGSPFEYIPWDQTAEGFLQEAEYMANMAREFCLPYLLGQKNDWEAVREYWRQETEKDLEKIKGYRFPPNVQKRWHLPPPPSDEKN
jgi:hypothetical protein